MINLILEKTISSKENSVVFLATKYGISFYH